MTRKGGSQSSNEVVSFVNPSAFEKLNQMFTNKVSFGGKGCKKTVQSIDLNEASNQKMMVYNKSGGKKTTKPKAKKVVKRKGLKGGDIPAAVPGQTCSTPQTDIFSVYDSVINSLAPPTDPLPPPHTPAPSPSSLNYSIIPTSQQVLSKQPITTMNPITKTTVYPGDAYQGKFALGGKPKVKRATKPKAKPAAKPKAKAKPAAKPKKTTKPKKK
jgi:hypothetical protein